MLSTPQRIRTLQRKLYLKAKQEPKYRFYALYDKVCRKDVLEYAYALVRANKGAAGVDGVTCQNIETKEGKEAYLKKLEQALVDKTYKAQPVRRVWIPKSDGGERPLGIPTITDRIVQMAVKLMIEPIYEADFCETSYGFRPGRSAHDAADAVSEGLRSGQHQVIDADLSKYFDSIPHDKLMKTVAERISDGAILALVKQWLKVPVIEEKRDGKRICLGGKHNNRGTPQGGVISPLLANLYLHLMDRIWESHNLSIKLGARLVRYADDFVILCARDTERPMQVVCHLMDKLGLTLNEQKTHIVNAKEESFDFLGFAFQMRKSRKTGNGYPHVEPSKKSLQRIKSEIRRMTDRRWTSTPMPGLIQRVNQTLRGWGNYFHYRHCSKVFGQIRWYTEERVRIHLRKRHKVRSWKSGHLRFPRQHLYEKYGLYKLPATAPWKVRMP